MATYSHLVPFHGRLIQTTVTHEASMAENWIMAIQSTYQSTRTVIVGLNCKIKPLRHHPIINKLLSTRIVTLQLCVDDKCLVLQLLHLKGNIIPRSIREFFLDERIIFVGIGISETVAKLENEYGLRIGKKIDIRDLVKANFPLSYRGKPGLKALAHQLMDLGSWKPRNLCLENVEAKVLDEEVVKFLCVDAYVCYRIGFKLLIQNV